MKDKRCECFSNASECPEKDCEGCSARFKSEEQIRAEAIEEFAERLKHRCYMSNTQCEMNYVMPWEIDEIAMELKGE